MPGLCQVCARFVPGLCRICAGVVPYARVSAKLGVSVCLLCATACQTHAGCVPGLCLMLSRFANGLCKVCAILAVIHVSAVLLCDIWPTCMQGVPDVCACVFRVCAMRLRSFGGCLGARFVAAWFCANLVRTFSSTQ